MNKAILFFNTIKFLKPMQVYYRLFYFIRSRVRKLFGFNYKLRKDSNSKILNLNNFIQSNSFYENNEFKFLNLTKKFDGDIDWNFNEFGKLWTYNLTYFEYLNKKEDVVLIYDFIENIQSVKDGLEPFPISLRGLSWIKFLTKFNIKDKKIDDSLYAQYYILKDNLEYHLLGNHLLENAFSLLFASYYFQNMTFYNKAKSILSKELEEQILKDGAHFELSPMYHQIMLYRVLECIDLMKRNNIFEDKLFLNYLILKAEKMLSWLKNITFKNGNIPLFNDSANKIAPSSFELFDYANMLQVSSEDLKFSDSGYRKFKKEAYECIVDISDIKATYIAGHTHSDIFNFELYINEKPFIVDGGMSTYQINDLRFLQRSTSSHNTVEINGQNQSQVWAGFRVAKRAFITDFYEDIDCLYATHDGYKNKFNALHKREWFFKDDSIIIKDNISNASKAIFRLHFHPKISKEDILGKIEVNSSTFEIEDYNYADEFNILQKAFVLKIVFKKDLTVKIKI